MGDLIAQYTVTQEIHRTSQKNDFNVQYNAQNDTAPASSVYINSGTQNITFLENAAAAVG